MSETAAPAPLRHAVPAPPQAPLHESRLFLFWVVAVAIFLQIWNNGYCCFRLDHCSQIPLLYLKQDPTLYARDWFLHGYGHFDLRKYHLMLMNCAAALLGLPAGILALYFLALGATVWTWLKISRAIYNSTLPGIVATLMATFMYGQEIGTNHLLEKEMIPRTEAYPFAWFGLYCALRGRPFLAGLLLAVGGLFQPAVGLLFALPIFIWILTQRAENPPGPPAPRFAGLRHAGLFLAGFVLPFSYRVFSLREAIQDNAMLSAGEEILLAAYIRHPHHMVPHLWGTMWVMFAALAALFVLAWRSQRSAHPAAGRLVRLALIIVAVLAVCTVFIELIPLKLVVLVQPYRMAVLLYFLMLLVIAQYLLELLRRPEVSPRLRALLLIMAPASRAFFTLFAIAELAVAAWEKRRGRLRDLHGLVVVALLVTISVILKSTSAEIDDDMRHIYRTAPPLALALLAAAWAIRKYNLLARRALVHAAGAAAVLCGLAAIGAFFWLPLDRWLDDPERKNPERLGELCWRFQFNPVPVKALERLGAWAGAHTPKDALFIMPPELTAEGFHVWSKRAAVFCFKYIPLKTSGLQEWKSRFLMLRGITDPQSLAGQAAIDEAMRDYGGLAMNRIYDNLTPGQVLHIAKHYAADYIITQKKYDDLDKAHFILQTEETNRDKKLKNAKPFYLFQIRLPGTADVPVRNAPLHARAGAHQFDGSRAKHGDWLEQNGDWLEFSVSRIRCLSPVCGIQSPAFAAPLPIPRSKTDECPAPAS